MMSNIADPSMTKMNPQARWGPQLAGGTVDGVVGPHVMLTGGYMAVHANKLIATMTRTMITTMRFLFNSASLLLRLDWSEYVWSRARIQD